MRKLPQKIFERIKWWNGILQSRKNEPFKIELLFKIGRCGNDVIAFDSVLLYYTFLFLFKEDFFNFSYDHDDYIEIDLPLSRIETENDFFYDCSWIPKIPEKSVFWTKRFEKSILNVVKEKRVSVRQGEYKSYRMPILYDDQKCYDIFGVGDIDIIQEILPNPFYVGKKTAIGFGECEYIIEEQKENEIDGLISNNTLLRPLPIIFVEEKGRKVMEGNRVSRPISPPYFGRFSRKHECWDVGTRIT